VPNSILWLLRFPKAGEEHLFRTAKDWAGQEVASRIRFTDVAQKDRHIQRGRVADLFLDTTEVCAKSGKAFKNSHVLPSFLVQRTHDCCRVCSLSRLQLTLLIAAQVSYGQVPPY
jgi:hypothetical protein